MSFKQFLCTVFLVAGLLQSLPTAAYGQLMSADLDTAKLYIDPNDPNAYQGTLSGSIRNLTDDTLAIQFIRTQSLPAGWNTNVCFGMNCYAESISTSTEVWQTGEMKALKVLVNYPPSSIGSSTLRLVIKVLRTGDSVVFNNSAEALPWQPVSCRTLRLHNFDSIHFPIDRIWLSDATNFTLTPLFEIPGTIRRNGGYQDYELCIIPRDGSSYSTTVFYGTDTNYREMSISMIAPSTGSVTIDDGQFNHTEIVSYILRTPSSLNLTIGAEGETMDIRIVDAAGRDVLSSSTIGRSIDLPKLTPGSYFLTGKTSKNTMETVKLLVY